VSGRRRATLVAVACSVVGLALATVAPARAAASLPSLGTIDIPYSDSVIVDTATRHLISIGLDASTNSLRGSLYDADSRSVIRRAPIGTYSLTAGGPIVYGWDATGRRLYVLAYGNVADSAAGTSPLILTLDADLHLLSAHPLGGWLPGLVVMGNRFDPGHHSLYVVGQANTQNLGGVHGVFVSELDAATETARWPRLYQVPNCQKLVVNREQAGVIRNPVSDHVYLGCGTGDFALVPEPGQSAVASIDVHDPAKLFDPGASPTSLYPLAGGYGSGDSLVDEVSNRFLMVSSTPTFPVQSVWVFDEAHNVFLGVVNAGSLNVLHASVDPDGGRLYVAVDAQILVSSQRGLKIPQANAYSVPTTLNGHVVPVHFNHTVLVPWQDSKFVFHYSVYRAPLPDYSEAAVASPDAQTSNPTGPTDDTFNGGSKSYGARLLQIGGVNGVVQNLAASSSDYWQVLQKPGNVNDGNRDVYFAKIPTAVLTSNEASASSISVDGDANTRADYATASGQAWPSAPAECHAQGGGPETKTADQTSVTCDTAGHSVKAAADHNNPTDVQGFFTMGSATTDAALHVDPKLGLVTTTTAEAKDVNLAGVAHFGEIISEATANAHGRPGTAHATYTRTFRNVSMPGFSCSDSCDPRQVVDHLNVVLAGKVVAELPTDEIEATPKGASGSAVRDRWQHQQDFVFNGQGEIEQQVGALRLTWINDNAARSRVMVEFAATQADASYFVNPSTTPLSGGDSTLAGIFAGSNQLNPDLSSVATGGQLAAGGRGGHRGGSSLVKRLAQGLRILLTGRGHTLLNIFLWTLLGLPVFLATRRRYLLRLIGEL
jgi:hypothetical protein